jgi:uncharacterized protein YbaR (Trm112 family)
MPVSKEFKALLICPKCRSGPLVFLDEQDEIRCERCKLSYAVKDGVLQMLIEEAKPLP